jgi:3-phenylpropionate/trans-cinnamate dioxygenase ferredoxin reductase subunit
VLVGSDTRPPYQRPPLSKAWLKGEAGETDLYLRPASFYEEQGITLELATSVTSVDPVRRLVVLSDGRSLEYSKLVLATGTTPRALDIPGIDLDGVITLQTADDAERIKQLVGPGRRLVVIGGGYLGLEIASAARSLGTDVVVLEREDRLLARVASEPVSTFFREEHERNGVELLLGVGIDALLPAEGTSRVGAVRLDDGTTPPCDAVVVSIGVLPNMDLAQAAGIECGNGIVVDENGLTSAPDVYAVGDVAFRPMWGGGNSRLESVPSALELASRAAAAIAGTPHREIEVPWFWSDQYDLKLQIAGIPGDDTSLEIRGNPADRSFSVFHKNGGRLRSVECVNAPRDFVAGKRQIAAELAESLADKH